MGFLQEIIMTMDNILLEPALDTVKGLLILDNDGNRILAKYYDQTWQGSAAQKKFEKTLFNTVSNILRKNVDKRSLTGSMELILLAVDEMIDGGIIIEEDPAQVTARVCVRSDDIPLGEQTVAQVFQSAKEQLKWSLLK